MQSSVTDACTKQGYSGSVASDRVSVIMWCGWWQQKHWQAD